MAVKTGVMGFLEPALVFSVVVFLCSLQRTQTLKTNMQSQYSTVQYMHITVHFSTCTLQYMHITVHAHYSTCTLQYSTVHAYYSTTVLQYMHITVQAQYRTAQHSMVTYVTVSHLTKLERSGPKKNL